MVRVRCELEEDCAVMARIMGRSMSTVAVLEIHMLRKAEASMKPRMRDLPPRPPTALTMMSARRLWAPDFSIALESMKPPRKRRMSLWPYAAAI